jgi:hypothetical protein
MHGERSINGTCPTQARNVDPYSSCAQFHDARLNGLCANDNSSCSSKRLQLAWTGLPMFQVQMAWTRTWLDIQRQQMSKFDTCQSCQLSMEIDSALISQLTVPKSHKNAKTTTAYNTGPISYGPRHDLWARLKSWAVEMGTLQLRQ